MIISCVFFLLTHPTDPETSLAPSLTRLCFPLSFSSVYKPNVHEIGWYARCEERLFDLHIFLVCEKLMMFFIGHKLFVSKEGKTGAERRAANIFKLVIKESLAPEVTVLHVGNVCGEAE
ncbi:hypothetical protein CEXT_53031 [Caerostris extrusa]|uniref:DRBM domain-containing protein n=1 Tax=Caerostris extrusa TaxID=172846 RepID=A0AAV4XV23_CAEEX|nr:hypothetical protein CEXT_53031 [Caerostris extrusa]